MKKIYLLLLGSFVFLSTQTKAATVYLNAEDFILNGHQNMTYLVPGFVQNGIFSPDVLINAYRYQYLLHEDGGGYIKNASGTICDDVIPLIAPVNLRWNDNGDSSEIGLGYTDKILSMTCHFYDDDNDGTASSSDYYWEVFNAHFRQGHGSLEHPESVSGWGLTEELLFSNIGDTLTPNNQNTFSFTEVFDPPIEPTAWTAPELAATGEYNDWLNLRLGATATDPWSCPRESLRFMGCELEFEIGPPAPCNTISCGVNQRCDAELGACTCTEPDNSFAIRPSAFEHINAQANNEGHNYISNDNSGNGGSIHAHDGRFDVEVSSFVANAINGNEPCSETQEWQEILAPIELNNGDRLTELRCTLLDLDNDGTVESLDTTWLVNDMILEAVTSLGTFSIRAISMFYENTDRFDEATDSWSTSYINSWGVPTSLKELTHEFYLNAEGESPTNYIVSDSSSLQVRLKVKPVTPDGNCTDDLLFGGCYAEYAPSDLCENQLCPENASCNPATGGCECVTGWTGDGCVCEDENECETGNFTCPGIRVCANTIGGYECECPSGYYPHPNVSVWCEDYNECTDGTADCGAHSTCENINGGYNCNCDDGYVDSNGVCVILTSVPMPTTTLAMPTPLAWTQKAVTNANVTLGLPAMVSLVRRSLIYATRIHAKTTGCVLLSRATATIPVLVWAIIQG